MAENNRNKKRLKEIANLRIMSRFHRYFVNNTMKAFKNAVSRCS